MRGGVCGCRGGHGERGRPKSRLCKSRELTRAHVPAYSMHGEAAGGTGSLIIRRAWQLVRSEGMHARTGQLARGTASCA